MRRELAHFRHVLRILQQWSADRLRALYCDVVITPKAHCLRCIEKFVKPALDASSF